MKTPVSVLDTSLAQVAAGRHPDNADKLDISGVLAFWKKNKYPLLALNHDNNPPELLNLPEFQAALNEENAIHDALKAEYGMVRERWAQAGICSLLIKSGGIYPSFPYTSDNLDVLIREEDKAAARKILREGGYLELKNIEEPRKFLFRKFSGGMSVSAIHLHTQVGWGVGFMDDKAVWERSHLAPDDPSITVPSPEDVILITIAHSFYENKRFRLADMVKIHEWWCRGSIDWEYMDKVARQRGWLDGLHFCLLLCAHIEEAIWGETTVPPAVREGWLASLKRSPVVYRYYQRRVRQSPVSLPYTISFVFGKYLYYKKILRDHDDSPLKKLKDFAQTLITGIRLKTRFRPQPSLLVSFSGPDGSGKTLHAETLAKTLDLCEVNVKYYWNRAATSLLLRFFSAVVKLIKGQPPSVQELKPGAPGRTERLRNPVLRFFWSYIAAADMAWSYFTRVRLPLFLGKVVICDRYVFDAAAEMECSLAPRDRINRLAIKLMLAVTPKPDIGYFLDIPEEICAQRKTENDDAEYLARQRKAYLELSARYNLKIKKTDREFEQTADEITREVLTSYYRDYGTFIRGLFLSNPGQLNKVRKEESK